MPKELPGRNAPCWCGSGKKYKKCHLLDDEKRAAEQYKPAPPIADEFDPIAGRWRPILPSSDVGQRRR